MGRVRVQDEQVRRLVLDHELCRSCERVVGLDRHERGRGDRRGGRVVVGQGGADEVEVGDDAPGRSTDVLVISPKDDDGVDAVTRHQFCETTNRRVGRACEHTRMHRTDHAEIGKCRHLLGLGRVAHRRMPPSPFAHDAPSAGTRSSAAAKPRAGVSFGPDAWCLPTGDPAADPSPRERTPRGHLQGSPFLIDCRLGGGRTRARLVARQNDHRRGRAARARWSRRRRWSPEELLLAACASSYELTLLASCQESRDPDPLARGPNHRARDPVRRLRPRFCRRGDRCSTL